MKKTSQTYKAPKVIKYKKFADKKRLAAIDLFEKEYFPANKALAQKIQLKYNKWLAK